MDTVLFPGEDVTAGALGVVPSRAGISSDLDLEGVTPLNAPETVAEKVLEPGLLS